MARQVSRSRAKLLVDDSGPGIFKLTSSRNAKLCCAQTFDTAVFKLCLIFDCDPAGTSAEKRLTEPREHLFLSASRDEARGLTDRSHNTSPLKRNS
jgi:hypothetical protein